MNRSFVLDAAALALLAAIALVLLVLIGHVRAEPLPQPKVGACPSGYTSRGRLLRADAPGPAACSASIPTSSAAIRADPPAHVAVTMQSLLSPAADMTPLWHWAAMCQELKSSR